MMPYQWLNRFLCLVAIVTFGHFMLEFTGSEPVAARYIIRETVLFISAMGLYLVANFRNAGGKKGV